MVENELREEDSAAFKNFMIMCALQFDHLLDSIKLFIDRQDSNMRKAVLAQKRLALTLRFLATGETYRSLMYASRIHESTISLFIPEVCRYIYDYLKDQYINLPTTEARWKAVAAEFNELWSFPCCIGAVDAKHIKFRAPRSSGSYFYNYKGDHRVNGHISDGGVYRASSLKRAIDLDALNFPPDKYLPGNNIAVPYTFVADDAFPLTRRILKPYPRRGLTNEKRIFNYRLTRARRVVENAFGILANRFRVLLNTINLPPNKGEQIVLTCCALHNFLISKNSNYIQVEQESILDNVVEQQGGNRPSGENLSVSDAFIVYFNNDGKVS